MRVSRSFAPTRKEPQKDARTRGLEALVRAGYLRRTTKGTTVLLPLGARALGKLEARGATTGTGAYAIVQALIARGVGDYRAGGTDAVAGTDEAVIAQVAAQAPAAARVYPDLLRFGFTPLYVGFADVWHAVENLRQVLETGEWQQPRFNRQHAVT